MPARKHELLCNNALLMLSLPDRSARAGGALVELRRMAHGYRTEGGGPVREAAAIGLGVFVGCSPFYGFHLLLCLALGKLLRLNRLMLYLAANVSNPIVAPFLLLSELQTGAWLRIGRPHQLTLETVRRVDPWVFGGDLLVGSAVVGTVLGAGTALLTYLAVRHSPADRWFAALVQRASDRYVGDSLMGWEFARGKLAGDPIYETVLFGGLLPSGGTLVDIGCGQGLMLALLIEARDAFRCSAWPATRTPPPQFEHLVGIESRRRVGRLARAALGDQAEVLSADVRSLSLPQCSAVLLFDVLQMMPRHEQDALLVRLRDMRRSDSVILIREADASAGWRFAMLRLGNRLKAVAGGSWRQRFGYRTRDEWLTGLARLGLDAEVCAAANGPFGNVLFRVTVRRT